MRKILVAVLAVSTCLIAASSCTGSKNPNLTMGDQSQLDTLSYALGANLGTFTVERIADIPFNYDVFVKGIKEAAFEKASMKDEEAVETFRTFVSATLPQRREAIAAQQADSLSTAEPIEIFANQSECDNVSYAYGANIGADLRNVQYPMQLTWFIKGFEEARAGQAVMDSAAVQSYIQNFFQVTYPAMEAERSAAWLAEIEKKSGVQKTESGLLYKVIKQGNMDQAATTTKDKVEVHYTGRTRDGKIFDSSYFANLSEERQQMMRQYASDRFDEEGNYLGDQTVSFELGRVIRGWTEGMQLIGPGGKIILYIPAELAYGPNGPREIGPNAALEFEVELISVEHYEEPEIPESAQPKDDGEPVKK